MSADIGRAGGLKLSGLISKGMKAVLFSAVVWLMMLFPNAAQAQNATCNFSVSNMSFGQLYLIGGSAYNSTANLTINCNTFLNLGSLSMIICASFNAGSGGATGNVRHMLGPSNAKLNYQLFTDANRTVLLGSTANTTLGAPISHSQILTLLLPINTTIPIYGRVLAGQNIAAGGDYLSLFTGGSLQMNYESYGLFPPNCSSVTGNPSTLNFTVDASVDRTCSVSTQNINFGTAGFLTTTKTASGNLSVKCSNQLAYEVGLSSGKNAATPQERKMKKGTDLIAYNLYRDPARTQIWGTATGQTYQATGNGLVQSIPVYAKIDPQNTPAKGIYSDTIIVTVTY